MKSHWALLVVKWREHINFGWLFLLWLADPRNYDLGPENRSHLKRKRQFEFEKHPVVVTRPAISERLVYMLPLVSSLSFLVFSFFALPQTSTSSFLLFLFPHLMLVLSSHFWLCVDADSMAATVWRYTTLYPSVWEYRGITIVCTVKWYLLTDLTLRLRGLTEECYHCYEWRSAWHTMSIPWSTHSTSFFLLVSIQISLSCFCCELTLPDTEVTLFFHTVTDLADSTSFLASFSLCLLLLSSAPLASPCSWSPFPLPHSLLYLLSSAFSPIPPNSFFFLLFPLSPPPFFFSLCLFLIFSLLSLCLSPLPPLRCRLLPLLLSLHGS